MPLVQATLAMLGVFPPPASSTHVLSWLDGSGAGFAADTGIALVVEFVVGHLVAFDIVPHLLLRPRDERVNFDELVLFIPLYHQIGRAHV